MQSHRFDMSRSFKNVYSNYTKYNNLTFDNKVINKINLILLPNIRSNRKHRPFSETKFEIEIEEIR